MPDLKRFPIEEFVHQLSIPYADVRLMDDALSMAYILQIKRKFALGDVVEVEHSHSKRVEQAEEIPASPIDWLKALLVEWLPTLNFGWLSPRRKWVEREITINYELHYMNVYPIDPENNDRFMSVAQPLTAYKWLTMPPIEPDKDIPRS